MKILIQISFMAIMLLGIQAFATESLPFGSLNAFTTDTCTNFPDGTLRDPQKWRHCCIEHDKEYWIGGTYFERLTADKEFYRCIQKTGEPDIALIMFSGVRIGGNPYLNTHWRWGYGWPKIRGYRALNMHEKNEVLERIDEERKTHLLVYF